MKFEIGKLYRANNVPKHGEPFLGQGGYIIALRFSKAKHGAIKFDFFNTKTCELCSEYTWFSELEEYMSEIEP